MVSRIFQGLDTETHIYLYQAHANGCIKLHHIVP